MSKPLNAIELPVCTDLTPMAMYDAVNAMDVDVATGFHLFVLRVNADALACSHALATGFVRDFNNLMVRTDIWPESTLLDEWALTHIESGITVYSPGA